mmetsp:Transcript_16671/g.38263  ORF Transcript_16671/g.38263 Transcript_16671/m.38263 type:complete len:267 (+) Transcript_16671:556-1356(+)
MRCNGNRSKISVIQKQNDSFGATGLFFNDLCSVPALSTSVVKESCNYFVHLNFTWCALGSIIGSEQFHAVFNSLRGIAVVHVAEKVSSTTNFANSDGQDFIIRFFGGFRSFGFNSLRDGPDSDLFRLCCSLSINKFLGCFTVINFSLVDRSQSSIDKLNAVVFSVRAISNKNGTNNNSTLCNIRAIDLNGSLKYSEPSVTLRGITKWLGGLYLTCASNRRGRLWNAHSVWCEHNVTIFRGDKHLESRSIEAVFHNSFQFSCSHQGS